MDENQVLCSRTMSSRKCLTPQVRGIMRRWSRCVLASGAQIACPAAIFSIQPCYSEMILHAYHNTWYHKPVTTVCACYKPDCTTRRKGYNVIGYKTYTHKKLWNVLKTQGFTDFFFLSLLILLVEPLKHLNVCRCASPWKNCYCEETPLCWLMK